MATPNHDGTSSRDHAAALSLVLRQARVGQSYNIGGGEERSNLDLARALCAILATQSQILG
jgi:dTDP-D-glucose 4,6-dehydratase